MIKKIIIEVKEREIELTLEEVKELRDALDNFLRKEHIFIHVQPYPSYPFWWKSYPRPIDITYSNGTGQ